MDDRHPCLGKIMESPTPFNLDFAIRHWRDRLGGSSALHPVDLTELEAHLRAATAELVAIGLNTEEAFFVAARRLGDSDSLAREFAKINQGRIWMTRATWMLAGILLSQVIVSLANVIGLFALVLARNILPYRHLQGIVGIIALLGAGCALVWLVCRLAVRHARRAARCVDTIARWPLFSALGLAILLEFLHPLNDVGARFFGVRSVEVVSASLEGVVQNIGAGHRPFGTGQLLYSLLQYAPQFILLFAFTLLVRRVVGQREGRQTAREQ